MNAISVIIHTRNNERTLSKAIRSVILWASEVLVVDMHSTDSTVELAKSLHAKVISVQDYGHVGPAKNEAINKAKEQWILVLEADEEISQTLATALQQLTELDRSQAYYIPRKNVIFGKWAKTGNWPDYSPRFFQKGAVEWPPVFEAEPIMRGKAQYLEAKEEYAILHNQHSSIEEFVDSMNLETSIAAQNSTNTHANMFRSTYEEFIRRFYQEKGYEGKTFGLSLALLHACYACVTAMKKWEMAGRPEDGQDDTVEEELDILFQQLCYRIADKHVQTERSFMKRLYWRVRRKFRI